MPVSEIRIYIKKWGTEIGYILIEDLTIEKLSYLVSRGYQIIPRSVLHKAA